MNKKIVSKKRAFTLAETLTAIMILGVVAAITVSSTINSKEYKVKKLKILTRVTYDDLSQALTQVLLRNTDNMNLSRMHEITDNAQENSELLKTYFMENMDLAGTSCNKLLRIMQISKDDENNITCAISNRNVLVGFKMNESCKLSANISTKNYLEDDLDISTGEMYTNESYNCGNIIYATRDSQGIPGRDLFYLVLGKKGFLY